VGIGTTVVVKVKGTKIEKTYYMVGSAEVDAGASEISNESPIGAALMEQKKGDIVAVETPRGEKKFEILSVSATK